MDMLLSRRKFILPQCNFSEISVNIHSQPSVRSLSSFTRISQETVMQKPFFSDFLHLPLHWPVPSPYLLPDKIKQLPNSCCNDRLYPFLRFIFYLKGVFYRVKRDSEFFHALTHSPNGPKGQS